MDIRAIITKIYIKAAIKAVSDHLEILATLVEYYEIKHYPILR